ncbi:hypothetical protein AXF42_Ash016743 [Apostasia shenzhenica]|uniref:Uncharacterized protein n=1 Tax=Apostasia shenzhenica TaxID=1088818 RepID=A0A2I0AQ68_9ASPA|nr:hypothetical protein AXF42_Ash016743 [Apostasia shenzhenica]
MEYYCTRRLLTLVIAAAVICGAGQMTTTTAEGEWTKLAGLAANGIAILTADVYNHLEPGQLKYLWALGAEVCYSKPARNGVIYYISFFAYLDQYGALPHGLRVKTMTSLVSANMQILLPNNISRRRAIILTIADFVYLGGFPFNENRHT